MIPLLVKASKTPHLRIQIRQICTPLSSLVRVHSDLVLQMRKSSGWDYDSGTVHMNLVC